MESANTYYLNRYVEETDKADKRSDWVESFREELIDELVSKDRVALRNGVWIDICEITDHLDNDIYAHIQKMNSTPFAGVKAASARRVTELWNDACDKGIAPHLGEYADIQIGKMGLGA